MPGEQLNVAQAAAGLMRISRRRSKRRFDTREGAPATGAEAQAIKAGHAAIRRRRDIFGQDRGQRCLVARYGPHDAGALRLSCALPKRSRGAGSHFSVVLIGRSLAFRPKSPRKTRHPAIKKRERWAGARCRHIPARKSHVLAGKRPDFLTLLLPLSALARLISRATGTISELPCRESNLEFVYVAEYR